MEFVVNVESIVAQRTGCVVVGVYEGGKLSPSATELDTASDRALSDALERGDLEGDLGATLLLARVPNVAAERVLLVGLGTEQEFSEGSFHTALGATTSALRTTGAADATLCVGELSVSGRDGEWKIEQAVLAVMDGLYRFDKLKSAPPRATCALA
ncbi:MAG TPA: M17 family peptidase N-terminal domain-containing protein, partial [Casimicrobiaceae bacterium]|nr:M17 family peptidase N-terminal domain-containing protein [Casimicrobiaceae bacterium]